MKKEQDLSLSLEMIPLAQDGNLRVSFTFIKSPTFSFSRRSPHLRVIQPKTTIPSQRKIASLLFINSAIQRRNKLGEVVKVVQSFREEDFITDIVQNHQHMVMIQSRTALSCHFYCLKFSTDTITCTQGRQVPPPHLTGRPFMQCNLFEPKTVCFSLEKERRENGTGFSWLNMDHKEKQSCNRQK